MASIPYKPRLGYVEWGPGRERKRTSEANWRKPLAWNRKAGAAGIRIRVFCASLADVFDNAVPETWRGDLWHLIRETPNVDWLLLTKRPQNIAKMLPITAADFDVREQVWLGTTAENQTEANRRIPALLANSAAVHFVSLEPLLSSVDLTPWLPGLTWAITGGESGARARPSHPDWFRSIRGQCLGASVPYFHKQNGEWAWYENMTYDEAERLAAENVPGAELQHHSCGRTAVRVGKKRAGRRLDGREWNEVPA